MPSKMTDANFIRYAREWYHCDGEIEIDEGAVVSRGESDGAYVQAWIWVANVPGMDATEAELDAEEEIPDAHV